MGLKIFKLYETDDFLSKRIELLHKKRNNLIKSFFFRKRLSAIKFLILMSQKSTIFERRGRDLNPSDPKDHGISSPTPYQTGPPRQMNYNNMR